jgi:hypothetical protein
VRFQAPPTGADQKTNVLVINPLSGITDIG